MKVKDLKEVLAGISDDLEVYILDTKFGGIGPSPSVKVRGVSEGFDWDSGKVLIHPEKNMTSVDKETIKSMITYANQAGWRQKYEREIAELKKKIGEK